MRKSRLFQIGAVLLMAALACATQSAIAQEPMPNFGETRPGMVPFMAGMTNGNVTFTWQLMPGKWELAEQKPAFTGDWTPVPAEKYQTNGLGVSVTIPLPKEGAIYRVRRTMGFHVPKLPKNLPPIPPPPTNRPPPPNRPHP